MTVPVYFRSTFTPRLPGVWPGSHISSRSSANLTLSSMGSQAVFSTPIIPADQYPRGAGRAAKGEILTYLHYFGSGGSSYELLRASSRSSLLYGFQCPLTPILISVGKSINRLMVRGATGLP